MSAPPPDHDWRPTLPIDSLSPASAATRSAVRELQGQLIEWRMLADRTANATLRGALYRNLRAWHALLDVHQPDPTGRCRRCRGRWGRSSTWPCAQFTDFVTALQPPIPATRRRTDE